MKKFLLILFCGLLTTLAGHAQSTQEIVPPFAKDKIYVGASLTGLGLNYNSNEKWHLGIDARGGWFFNDDWLLLGTLGIDTRYHNYDTFTLGAGVRYYIEQNGLYLGAGANYVHVVGIDDFRPTVQVGYAYFLNGTVTIEPEVYYSQSFKNHSDFSGFGLRLGIGLYFNELFK